MIVDVEDISQSSLHKQYDSLVLVFSFPVPVSVCQVTYIFQHFWRTMRPNTLYIALVCEGSEKVFWGLMFYVKLKTSYWYWLITGIDYLS